MVALVLPLDRTLQVVETLTSNGAAPSLVLLQADNQLRLRYCRIAELEVFVEGNGVFVFGPNGELVRYHEVPPLDNDSEFPSLLGIHFWQTSDYRILGLIVERGPDYSFGYALNLDSSDLSEWGYCP